MKPAMHRRGEAPWICVLVRTLLVLGVLAQAAGCGLADPSTSPSPARTLGSIQDRSIRAEPGGWESSYALFVPSSYREGHAAPLVVLLHGLYSTPSQVIRYQGITEEAEKRGYVVVAPYGYNAYGWYGSLGPGNEFARRFRLRLFHREAPPEDLGHRSEQDVLQVMQQVRQDLAIDPDRIYLMGHSMGGGGALHLAMKLPSRWAAIAPLAPAIYSDPAEIRKVKGVPAIVVQGTDDRLVPVESTRRWVEAMQRAGLPHEYIEIPGGGHILAIARNPQMIARVFDFFDAHRRR
jgi:poly(3-hydroxybutyrate) depolymerase